MKRDRWDGQLSGHAFVEALAGHAARRRAARELAEEEDIFEAPAEEEPLRLAALDREQRYESGRWSVLIRDGAALQTAGPGGLCLAIDGASVPLVVGTPVRIVGVELGETIVATDASGRKVLLKRV